MAPGSGAGLVERPRLISKLENAGTPVVLLNAPSGYGKSVLVRQWSEVDPRPFVPVLLGEYFNDPALLLASIVEALDRVEPVSADVLDALSSPEPGIERIVLPRLRDSLASRKQPLVLFLDELEHIDSPDSLAVISAVGKHMPRASQLVLASRREPGLPVGSLRAHRQLTEFGATDLTLSKSEGEVLLAGLGLNPTPKQLDVLMQRTEGWPAALYLAGMALAESTDLGSAVRRFAGDDRIVVDYIRDEFLLSVSQSQLEFLRRAAVMDRLSGDLCDFVLETSGSAALLRDLSRSNMLLIPLDRRDEWFRFHPLFRDMLESELRKEEPEAERDLNRRASDWWAGRGDWDRAINHAISCGAINRAGELLWLGIPEYVTRGRNPTVIGWLDMLGEEAVSSDPALSLTAAATNVTRGDGVMAEHWLAVARRLLNEDHDPGEFEVFLNAGLAMIGAALARNGIQDMNALAGEAAAVLPDDNPWMSLCRLLQGASLHLTGRREEAREMLTDGARRGAVSAPNVQGLCLAQLALMSIEEDDWHRADQLISQARKQINQSGLIDYPMMALAMAISAGVRARAGLPEKAAEDLAIARNLLDQLNDFAPWYELETRLGIARAAARLGDHELANEMFAEARRTAALIADATVVDDWLTNTAGIVETASASTSGTLTPAELRILQYLPTHLSFPQIAERSFFSTNTVKTHARNVYRKLDAASRQEAVEKARTAGMLDESSGP